MGVAFDIHFAQVSVIAQGRHCGVRPFICKVKVNLADEYPVIRPPLNGCVFVFLVT